MGEYHQSQHDCVEYRRVQFADQDGAVVLPHQPDGFPARIGHDKNTGEKEQQQTVRDYVTELNRTLPLYKRIGVVEFSETPLPRNATGKLVR